MKKSLKHIEEKLQKVIKIDFRFLVKNGFWVSLNQIVSFFTGIVISILFARFVSKEAYGQYTYLFSIFSLVSIVAIPGFNSVVFRAVSKGYDGTYKKAVKFSFFASFLALPILFIISAYYFFIKEDEIIAKALFLVSFLFPFHFPFKQWGNFVRAKENFKNFAINNSIILLFNFIVISFLIFNNASILVIFVSSVTVITILNFYFWFRTDKLIKNDKVEEGWKASGLKLMLPTVFSLFYDYIDKIVLMFFLGEKLLAEYTIAVLPADKLRFFIAAIITIYFPKIFRIETRIILKMLSKKTFFIIVFSAISLFLLAFVLPFIMDLLFTKTYNESFFPAQIYISILPFYVLTAFLGNILIKEKAENYFTITVVISSIINIAAYFILIPEYGIMGGVIGSIIYFVVQSLLRLAYVYKRYA